MKTGILIFVVFFAFVGAEDTEDDVLVLTKDNFKETFDNNKFVLVEFYAPWCGHCKALAPEYSKAAKELADENSDIKLAKVDATIETELAKSFEVRGYPTLKFFVDGKPKEYGGGRTADEIVNWLKKKTGPAAIEVEHSSVAEKMIAGEEIVILGFFKDQSSKSAKLFLEVAQAKDDFKFGITSADAVFDKFEVKKDSIILFKDFDEKKNILDSNFDLNTITNFISANSLPLVSEFSDKTAPKIFGGDIKKHLLLFAQKSTGEFATVFADFTKSAADFKGKLLFVLVDGDVEENERVGEYFGITKDEMPTLRLINVEEDMAKYKPDSDKLDAASIKAFAQSFLDGKLKKHLKTAGLPKDWDAKPVKVLVGSNFNEIAMDKSKNVFVEFYAPWCGHCKELAPIWDDLAEKYKDTKDLVIANLDSTANDLEQVQIQGFPTLKLFKKSTNEIINYNGGRTLDDLVKFIESDFKEGSGEVDEDLDEDDEEDEDQDETDKTSKDEL